MNSPRLFHVLLVLFHGYRQTPLTLALVIIAMLAGCAGLTAVLVINDAAKQSYANINQPLINNVTHLIVAKPTERLSQSDYSTLRIQGFTQLVAVAEQRLTLPNLETVQFLGLDYYAILNLLPELPNNSAVGLADKLVSQQARYLIHPQYADQLDSTIYQRAQQTLVVNGQRYGPVNTFEGPGMGNQVIADIVVLYEDFADTNLSYLMVAGSADSLDALNSALPPHLTMKPVTTAADATELTASFHLNLLAMGLLMLVVCVFVIMNALHLLMSKRINTFKVLRQLGINNATLIQASIVEMLALSLLATFAGVLLGLVVANWLSPAVNQTIDSLYGIKIGASELSLAWIFLQSFGACLLGALIAIILPLRRINQSLSIASDTNLTPPTAYLWAILTTVSLSLAALLLLTTDGLLWSFVVIALLILGGCSLILMSLPLILRALRYVIPLRLAIVKWSVADALRISHRSNVALCAFFIAVAANIGMNLMVDSFREATNSWLKQRLDGDIYVYALNAQNMVKWINSEYPQFDVVLRRSESGTFAEDKVQIRSFPSTAERQKSLLFAASQANVWSAFNANQGVLINQQFALSKNLNLGDSVLIERTNGKPIELPVVGVYFDYGNPKLQILLPPSQIAASTNERQIVAVYTSGEERDTLLQFKQRASGQFPQANLVLTKELLELSMQTFDRTFVITMALNIITLLVAAFSLATSVLIIDKDNAPQRALMKSLGVTSKSLLVAGIMQYSLLCLFICLLAIPFGIGLSWLLINLVNVQAFFWSYPLSIKVTSLFEVVLMSLGLIVALVALPTAKSARTAIAQEVKWLCG